MACWGDGVTLGEWRPGEHEKCGGVQGRVGLRPRPWCRPRVGRPWGMLPAVAKWGQGPWPGGWQGRQAGVGMRPDRVVKAALRTMPACDYRRWAPHLVLVSADQQAALAAAAPTVYRRLNLKGICRT